MKQIFILVFFISISIKGHAGVLNLGPAAGVERINNKFNVDLGAVKGLYRFNNGLTIGAVAMFGDVSFQNVPGEARYEAIVGYTSASSNHKLLPYVFASKGRRAYYSARPNVWYHTVTLGTKYNLTPKVYLDTSYRHRNTNDISWESSLYSIGAGYNISNTLAVQLIIGTTWGDYRSNQMMFSLVKRFQ